MSLRNSLYHIIRTERSETESRYCIRFDALHPVFGGHFPGHPIVPGACLVQIAEELLSDSLSMPVHFTAIRNLKFRRPVTPDMLVTYSFLSSGKTPDTFTIQLLTLNDIDAEFTATYMCTHSDLQ